MARHTLSRGGCITWKHGASAGRVNVFGVISVYRSGVNMCTYIFYGQLAAIFNCIREQPDFSLIASLRQGPFGRAI